MPTRRFIYCKGGDFNFRYRVEHSDGTVDLSRDIPDVAPKGATFWQRHSGLWVEITQPTAAEYEAAF